MVPGSFPSCSERAATATAAPARARATATVAPMPRLAPATKAVLPSSVTRSLFRREAQRSVETNDLAVEVVVLDDALCQLSVFGGAPHSLGERHLRTPVLLELVGGLAVCRRVDGAGRNGVDADAQRRQVTCGNKRHPEHAALGRRV